jgi:hypothetical protein
LAKDEASVFRKVYFFKVAHFDDVKESLPGALDRIASLGFTDSGRYKLDVSSRVRYSAYPDTTEYPIKLRFGKIRRDTLPDIERAGKLDTLAIDEDAGIIDLSHAIIFPDGFVAAEWNPDGPKLAALGSYIFEKGRMNAVPKFHHLVERDIVETLKKLVAVRVIELDIPPDAIELAREADKNLAAAVESTAALGATKKTGLVLTADKPAKPLRDLAVKIASILKSRPHERDLLDGFSVRGYGDDSKRMRYIDVLESKLMTAEAFLKNNERSRSLKTEDAYSTLEIVYQQNLERIRSAVSTPDLL